MDCDIATDLQFGNRTIYSFKGVLVSIPAVAQVWMRSHRDGRGGLAMLLVLLVVLGLIVYWVIRRDGLHRQ